MTRLVLVPVGTASELFEAQVARTPDAVAVICGDARVSYGELNARANRLARVLVKRGVGPERLVGLALPRSVDMVVAVLAVLKAGGAFLPIDTDYPGERIAFMLQDAEPVCVLTTGEVASGLPVWDAGRVLCVDDPAVMAAAESMAEVDLTESGPERSPAADRSGVCDLYVGVDGSAEGCECHAHWAGQFGACWRPTGSASVWAVGCCSSLRRVSTLLCGS